MQERAIQIPDKLVRFSVVFMKVHGNGTSLSLSRKLGVVCYYNGRSGLNYRQERTIPLPDKKVQISNCVKGNEMNGMSI